MEDRNQKIATFRNHYGAMMLKKSLGESCTLRAVPRTLSSSCGTCVQVDGRTRDEILAVAKLDLLEGLFVRENDGYRAIYG